MQASVVDMRYKTKEIIHALDRNESVEIFYRGIPKGTIVPHISATTRKKASQHPFFGMATKESEGVELVMDRLRGGRFDAL